MCGIESEGLCNSRLAERFLHADSAVLCLSGLKSRRPRVYYPIGRLANEKSDQQRL